MVGQCQLYITKIRTKIGNKYSRIIDKYPSISYVRQLRDNSLRVQTNSNCYKSQEERGEEKKNLDQPYLLFFFYTCESYFFLSFFFFFFLSQKVNQTNACNVRLSAPDSYRRNVVEWSSKTIEKYFAVSIPSIYIYIYISRVSISSYRARTRLLRISRHSFFFHFYFLVKSNNGS